MLFNKEEKEELIWKLDKMLEKSNNVYLFNSNILNYLQEELIEIRHEYYYILEEEKRLFIFEYEEKEDQKRKREEMLEEYRKDEKKIKDNKEIIRKRINRYIELLRKEELEDLELWELWAIEDKYHRLIYFSRIDPVDPIRQWVVKTLRTIYRFEWIKITKEQEELIYKLEEKINKYFLKNKEQIKDHWVLVIWIAMQIASIMEEDSLSRIPEELKEILESEEVPSRIKNYKLYKK